MLGQIVMWQVYERHGFRNRVPCCVLIYEDGPGRRCEEPHVYAATHPEIAYQLALADGNEQRYGRRFMGLWHLEEITEDVEPIARSQGGDARELVVSKDSLAAFSDPRWKGVACDETELAKALRGPPLLFEVEGLDSIPWHQYTHAYGTASDVPKDIRRRLCLVWIRTFANMRHGNF